MCIWAEKLSLVGKYNLSLTSFTPNEGRLASHGLWGHPKSDVANSIEMPLGQLGYNNVIHRHYCSLKKLCRYLNYEHCKWEKQVRLKLIDGQTD